jgi:hypothetical protein
MATYLPDQPQSFYDSEPAIGIKSVYEQRLDIAMSNRANLRSDCEPRLCACPFLVLELLVLAIPLLPAGTRSPVFKLSSVCNSVKVLQACACVAAHTVLAVDRTIE